METIAELKQVIDQFAQERDWNQFHSPANLAKSIAIEASELLACFQWNDENYSREAVQDELADVMNYCIRLASVMQIDIREAILQKIEKNAKKYPIEKAKGKSTKYHLL